MLLVVFTARTWAETVPEPNLPAPPASPLPPNAGQPWPRSQLIDERLIDQCESHLSRRLAWAGEKLDRFDEYPVWFRLEYFFTRASDRAVATLFEKVSEDLLLQAHERVQKGKSIAGKDAQQFISDLVWMNQRAPKTFWTKSEKPGVSQREFILSVLNELKRNGIHEQMTGAFRTDPQKSIEALFTTERSLLEVTSQKPETQSVILHRFFQPLYKKVTAALGVIDYVRDEARMIMTVDEMLQHAISHRQEFNLNEEEVGALEKSHRDTLVEQQEIQVLIAKNFGVSVAQGNAILPEDIDIYALKIEFDPDSMRKHTEEAYGSQFVKINRLENAWTSASKRLGHEVYPMEQRPTLQLQTGIDIREHASTTIAKIYQEICDRQSSASYEDHWTETETYRSMTGTRSGKISRNAERHPTYQNIIKNNFEARGKTQGLDEIRNETAMLREHEDRFQSPVLRSQELLQHLMEILPPDGRLSPESQSNYETQLKASLEELEALEPSLSEYSKLPEDQILAQWNFDSPADFRSRNEALYALLMNEIRLTKAVLVLLKQNASLVLPSQIPPLRDAYLKPLRSRWWMTRLTQASVAGTATAYGIAGALYPPVFSPMDRVLEILANDFVKLIGM